jgi:hypothetical protein
VDPGDYALEQELTAVRRAFDSAFFRMCLGTHADVLQDELSNALHHMYRLGELCKRQWEASSGGCSAGDFIARVRQVPGALGALWIRAFDTHQLAALTELNGQYSRAQTAMVRALIWKPASAMPFLVMPRDYDRYTDYLLHLSQRPVHGTLRAAFDGLAALPAASLNREAADQQHGARALPDHGAAEPPPGRRQPAGMTMRAIRLQ